MVIEFHEKTEKVSDKLLELFSFNRLIYHDTLKILNFGVKWATSTARCSILAESNLKDHSSFLGLSPRSGRNVFDLLQHRERQQKELVQQLRSVHLHYIQRRLIGSLECSEQRISKRFQRSVGLGGKSFSCSNKLSPSDKRLYCTP